MNRSVIAMMMDKGRARAAPGLAAVLLSACALKPPGTAPVAAQLAAPGGAPVARTAAGAKLLSRVAPAAEASLPALSAAASAVRARVPGGSDETGALAARPPLPPDAARHGVPAAQLARAPQAASGPAADAGVPGGYAGIWLTTSDRIALLGRQPDVALAAPVPTLTPWSPGVETAGPLPAGPHAINIVLSQPRQTMAGFGATLSAASAWLLQQRLDPASRTAVLDDLFSRRGDGLGLGFVRLYLGASEFARSRYSYGDTADGGDDPGLTQVSLAPDRDTVIPLVLEAMARNPALELVGSPTSAPGWMKTSASVLQGSLKPDAYGAYARYLQRIIRLYLEEGIPLAALTLQNDPQVQPPDAPGMQLDARARAELVAKHLGPLLQEEGTQLLEWDGDWDGAAGVRKVLADHAAAPYLAGVAWHCHGGAAGEQGVLSAERPELDAYITECAGGSWAPQWGDNLLYFARMLATGVRNGARGIALGNLALDEQGGPRTGGCRGCRGVLTISEGGVVRNPEYYALAHASRWVLPGARALPAGAGRDGVEQAAFGNPDGSVVVLVVNSALAARAVTVRAGARGFGYVLPAGSVATVVWRP